MPDKPAWKWKFADQKGEPRSRGRSAPRRPPGGGHNGGWETAEGTHPSHLEVEGGRSSVPTLFRLRDTGAWPWAACPAVGGTLSCSVPKASRLPLESSKVTVTAICQGHRLHH